MALQRWCMASVMWPKHCCQGSSPSRNVWAILFNLFTVSAYLLWYSVGQVATHRRLFVLVDYSLWLGLISIYLLNVNGVLCQVADWCCVWLQGLSRRTVVVFHYCSARHTLTAETSQCLSFCPSKTARISLIQLQSHHLYSSACLAPCFDYSENDSDDFWFRKMLLDSIINLCALNAVRHIWWEITSVTSLNFNFCLWRYASSLVEATFCTWLVVLTPIKTSKSKGQKHGDQRWNVKH